MPEINPVLSATTFQPYDFQLGFADGAIHTQLLQNLTRMLTYDPISFCISLKKGVAQLPTLMAKQKKLGITGLHRKISLLDTKWTEKESVK